MSNIDSAIAVDAHEQFSVSLLILAASQRGRVRVLRPRRHGRFTHDATERRRWTPIRLASTKRWDGRQVSRRSRYTPGKWTTGSATALGPAVSRALHRDI